MGTSEQAHAGQESSSPLEDPKLSNSTTALKFRNGSTDGHFYASPSHPSPDAIDERLTGRELNEEPNVFLSDRAVQWANSLELAVALAKSLPISKDDNALDQICKLHDNPVALDGILKSFCVQVQEKIIVSSKTLRQALTVKAEQKLQSKYTINSMECGGIDDFHNGILKRIGNCLG